MKVIIAGSREGFTMVDIDAAISQANFDITEVVSGTARGVDRFGEQWAKEKDIPIKRFPANWELNGRSAGHIRNRQMGEYADALIALWDGDSRGTKGMIDYMKKLEKPYYVYR